MLCAPREAVPAIASCSVDVLYEHVTASSQLASKAEQLRRLAQVARRKHARARRGGSPTTAQRPPRTVGPHGGPAQSERTAHAPPRASQILPAPKLRPLTRASRAPHARLTRASRAPHAPLTRRLSHAASHAPRPSRRKRSSRRSSGSSASPPYRRRRSRSRSASPPPSATCDRARPPRGCPTRCRRRSGCYGARCRTSLATCARWRGE
eukprot:6871242-Prymnesium_polylepis.1